MFPGFDDKSFQAYLIGIGKKEIHHKYYHKTIAHAEEMGVHMEGDKPTRLLTITRPNETEEQITYRLEIYEPTTLGLAQKMINTINRIFNERFFQMQFPKMPKTIPKDEMLAAYTRENYPGYKDIMGYIKETFTTKDFSDPNAVIYVRPKDFDVGETEFLKPIAIIYTSWQVVDFVPEVYYTILLGPETIKIITGEEVRVYTKDIVEGSEIWELVPGLSFENKIGKPPVFRLGGVIKGLKDPYWFMSFVGGVAPAWNRVVTLTSDLDANYIGHLFMERWEYEVECDACHGEKFITRSIDGEGDDKFGEPLQVKCPTCHGEGSLGRSPLGVFKIRHDAINPDRQIPTPPADYIEKSTDIVTKVEERIEKLELAGLSSVNMEILNNTPAAESGIAKAIDRQDLDAFLMRYQMHVFEWVLPNLMLYISWWRYGALFDWNEEKIKEIQPEILSISGVDFTVFSLKFLTDEYKAASQAPVSSNYRRQLEEEIVNTRFAGKEEERKKNLVIVQLQPFPGKTEDDLLILQNISCVEDWMVCKSLFIDEFVQRAIEENEKFLEMSHKEQREIVNEMAKSAEVPIIEPAPIPPALVPPPE